MNQLLRCAVWNVCSLNNKLVDVMEYILDKQCDIAFISETWLKSDKNNVTADIKNYGYTFMHNIRDDPDKVRGGGVGIMFKSTLSPIQVNSKSFSSFEHTVVKLPCANNNNLLLICIYRLMFIPVLVFHEEFAVLLEMYTMSYDSFIIAGDINIHVETGEISSIRFHEQLDLFDLKQHVISPTHIMGHTIDVVITKNSDSIIDNFTVTEYSISHHFMIDFTYKIEPKIVQTKTISYRSVKKLDSQKFSDDILISLSSLPNTNNLKDTIDNYNSAMQNIVDIHAPHQTKTIKLVPHAPWFDAEYANLRRVRRKAERKFRRSGHEGDKVAYVLLQKQTTALSVSKKKSYITDKLQSNTSSKEVYNVVNQLLDNQKEVLLPSSNSNVELANEFCNFFSNKVAKIRESITANPIPCSTEADLFDSIPNSVIPLSDFEPATLDELRQIILSFGVKCSPEAPVPASLLKKNIDMFIPYWLKIVNLSLELGSMDSLKSAVIFPLIKELGSLVDKEQFKNYRPVSNLQFISKLIERIVNARLEDHMARNNLHETKQFGYKKNHSTEYLLLKIIDNLLLNCDNGMPSVVLFLDLSAAFDTVDHQKLLHILNHDIGVTGTVLKWFESFLVNRTFRVKIENSYSQDTLFPFGVAQGSVLGPRLFNIYTKTLYKYVAPTKFNIVGFADDHQLLKHFIPKLQRYALGEGIQQCLNSIADWMTDHFLCLNESKTKIIIVAPPSIQKEIVIRGVFVNKNCIRFVDTAKNLGVLIDAELSFDAHITKVVKTCFAFIRKLHSIKHFLHRDHLKTLVCSYIFSRLDYCNSLFYGLNSTTISKLQHVQNCAARLIQRKCNIISLENVFLQFHWLQIKERILYKVLLIVHKCLQNQAPEPLSQVLQYAELDRLMNLRETRVKSRYGDRAFSHVGPKLWNLLPPHIRGEHKNDVFKKKLKSFLMTDGLDYRRTIRTH